MISTTNPRVNLASIETLLSTARSELTSLRLVKDETQLAREISKIEQILDAMKPTILKFSCSQREIRSLKNQLTLMEKHALYAQAVISTLEKQLKLTQEQNSILHELVKALGQPRRQISHQNSSPHEVRAISVESSPTLSEANLFRPIIPTPSPSPRSEAAPMRITSPEHPPARRLLKKGN